MSSFNPRRFVNPDTLSRVAAANLLQLLTSTASGYFATPAAPGGPPRLDLTKPLDFKELTRILLTADDADYPDDLADALYHIATFSEEDSITELLDAFAGRLNLAALGPEPSPSDVSLAAWLLDAPLVERTLGERQLYRSKSWVHYIGPTDPASPIGVPPAAQLAALETALKDWFLKNRGSDFVRVLPYAKGDEIYQKGHAKHSPGIHRLVLEAFVGPCPAGHAASHINGVKTDNTLANLRWEDWSTNNLRRTAHGRMPLGSAIKASKLTEAEVASIRQEYRGVGDYTRLAKKYGVSRTNIANIIRRKWWKSQ